MTQMPDPPDFLRKIPLKGPTMTAAPVTAAAPKAKKRRQDCYIARAVIEIPLDMANADSLSNAIKAVARIKDGLPAGASVKVDGSLGKMAAE